MRPTLAFVALALSPLAAPVSAPEQSLVEPLEANRPVVDSDRARMTGGGFALEASPTPSDLPQGGGYVVDRVDPASTTTGAGSPPGCLCFDRIFSDDFESGDTGAWHDPRSWGS